MVSRREFRRCSSWRGWGSMWQLGRWRSRFVRQERSMRVDITRTPNYQVFLIWGVSWPLPVYYAKIRIRHVVGRQIFPLSILHRNKNVSSGGVINLFHSLSVCLSYLLILWVDSLSLKCIIEITKCLIKNCHILTKISSLIFKKYSCIKLNRKSFIVHCDSIQLESWLVNTRLVFRYRVIVQKKNVSTNFLSPMQLLKFILREIIRP